MKKNHLFLATAIVALAGCSDNTYMGDLEGGAGTGTGAISFNMNTPTLSRASGASAAEKLDYKFKVYGVKKTGSTYSNVFASGIYNAGADYNADPDAYWVWYNASTANTTTSNTADWDYVGAAGTHGTASHEATVASGKDQTIKYWDYGADQYEFVAYSATVAGATISKYRKDGFTVTATPAQLAGLYIADKLTISTKNNTPTQPSSGYNKIGNIVQFTFRAAGAKVRLGIYETIPGYAVQNVKFRPNSAEFEATTANAKLSGSFNGTSSSTSGTYNVTYNSTTGIAEFDATASASNYFDFGTFASATPTAIGETSTTPMWASGSADYQSVLPNTDNPANMILYVDYDLYNSVSGETIHVKGAKAVVPSMYMTWNPNYAYTYLFKISDNTNGTTGTEGTSPEGIFPITFDALTIATTDGAEVGTITTVSTPAITTYQESSVSAAGITYAASSKPIYITINTTGTLADLTTSNTKLYTVAAGTTEADLVLTTKTKTASGLLSILAANEEIQGVTFTSGKTAKFTPAASTTYAIEYKVSDAVAAVYTAVPNETTLTLGNTYYTSDAGAGEFVSVGTEVSNGTNYYTLTTPASPAVYQYKIIVVGP
ncbi:MAG: hypothetical protein IJ826_10115 [Bacteroidaceae bacterium]|nr:hypothetical protein [Bacteroidaceae bacterium]